jgi:L-cysteine desulfidase
MSATNRAATAAHPRGRKAAEKATEKNSVRVPVPGIGTVTLPPAENLAFLGGIVLLTALEVIEWPVAVALAAGHALIARSHNKVIQDFGKALEEA